MKIRDFLFGMSDEEAYAPARAKVLQAAQDEADRHRGAKVFHEKGIGDPEAEEERHQREVRKIDDLLRREFGRAMLKTMPLHVRMLAFLFDYDARPFAGENAR